MLFLLLIVFSFISFYREWNRYECFLFCIFRRCFNLTHIYVYASTECVLCYIDFNVNILHTFPYYTLNTLLHSIQWVSLLRVITDFKFFFFRLLLLICLNSVQKVYVMSWFLFCSKFFFVIFYSLSLSLFILYICWIISYYEASSEIRRVRIYAFFMWTR